jgi:hypothetical protein
MLPSQELMQMANELAESLCTVEGLSAFRKALRFQREVSAAPAVRQPERVQSVGIWQREIGHPDLPFIRSNSEDSGMWADVEQIPPRNSRKRVVLIGESVARGFFYDPYINPAAVLEKMLRQGAGEDVEVIDLARSDLQIWNLTALLQSCAALEPDAVVIFAGNNWHPAAALAGSDLSRVAAALRQSHDWIAAKQFLEARLIQHVRYLVRYLGGWSREQKVPIVFLVPEFNLRDWRTRTIAPVLLDDDALAQWFTTRDRAECAAERGLSGAAKAAAAELLRLDQGTSTAGYSIQLRMALDSEETADLRKLAESARDSEIALTSHTSPRCFRIAQDMLLTEGPQQGLTLVNLPAYFQEYLNGDLPGRTLFHDYCHLTLDGMRVAMAPAAESLLPLLFKGAGGTWKDLMKTDITVGTHVRAQAALLAAIDNARMGNSSEIVEYELKNAIHAEPGIIYAARKYLDCHIREAPMLLCDSFAEFLQTGKAISAFFLKVPMLNKIVNCRLVDQFAQVLDEFQAGSGKMATDLMIAEHKLTETPLNLSLKVRPYSAAENGWDEYAYLHSRSCAREFTFVVVCEQAAELEIHLTARTGGIAVEGGIVVRVNGVTICTCPAKSEWSKISFRVPEHVVTRGVNRLQLVWPERAWVRPDRVSRICESLDLGRIPECRAIFGEVQTVSARVIPAAAPADELLHQSIASAVS